MFFFQAYFTFYNRLQFHPSDWNWFKCILFNVWALLHCEYVPQLSYPFICWWTSRLLPCPGNYKQCCDEHWGARVSFNSGFLSVYAQQWHCWVIWQFYFQFLFYYYYFLFPVFKVISTLFLIVRVPFLKDGKWRKFPQLNMLEKGGWNKTEWCSFLQKLFNRWIEDVTLLNGALS